MKTLMQKIVAMAPFFNPSLKFSDDDEGAISENMTCDGGITP